MKKDSLQVKIKELDRLLKKVIDSEVPKGKKVGLYYSGGIDSALIKTYYPFKKLFTYDDKKYTKEDFYNELPDVLKASKGPCNISFSPFGWYELGKAAKLNGMEYVVSGECADELFGGYPRYFAEFGLNYQAKEMFPSYCKMFPCLEDANSAGKRDFKGPLQVLLQTERNIAEYFGLKIIFPFENKEVQKFAFSLDPKMKMWDYENKVILRRLLEKRNPKYKHFEKVGLYCSVNKWIGSDPKSYDKKDWIAIQNKFWKEING